MRRLKEEVKAGRMTAVEARTILSQAAAERGEGESVRSTKTYRWLTRRMADAGAN